MAMNRPLFIAALFLGFFGWYSATIFPAAGIPRLSPFPWRRPEQECLAEGFLKLRVGSPKEGYVWHYTGVLRNPLSGAEVVGVEGLEVSRRLTQKEAADIKHDDENNGNSKNLNHRGYPEEPSSSFISHKVFIYTDIKNRTSPIRQFRRGKFGPLRPVNPVKIFYQVISLSSRGNGNQTSLIERGIAKGAGEVSVKPLKMKNKLSAEVEYPGGRRLQTQKITIVKEHGETASSPFSSPESDSSSSGAATRNGAIKSGQQQYRVVSFVRGKAVKPVSRWISFSSPQNSASGRSQEYYTISSQRSIQSTINKLRRKLGNTLLQEAAGEDFGWSTSVLGKFFNSLRSGISGVAADKGDSDRYVARKAIGRRDAVIRYTRYGECPPWYAIGGYCVTELVGSRYSDINDVPSHVRQLVSENCPGFLTQVLDKDIHSTHNDMDKNGIHVNAAADGDSDSSDSDGSRHSETHAAAKKRRRPYWWSGRQLRVRREEIGIDIDEFHSKGDPLDRYKPWYSHLTDPFRRKKVAAITELLANNR